MAVPKRLHEKAERKAHKAYLADRKKYDAATRSYKKARNSENNYRKRLKKANKKNKYKYQRLYNQAAGHVKSRRRAKSRAQKRYSKAKSKYNKIRNANRSYRLNRAIPNKIQEQKSEFNQGHAAIYPSSGDSSTVIFMSPTDTEQEDTQSNITSYAVDKGAPYSNYARVNSKTITVGGLLTSDGEQSKEPALNKYRQLRVWNSRHTTLTYHGNILYKHLLISDLQRTYSTFKYDIKVSITFTFVYAAKVTTTSKKKRHSKSSKSSKTKAGNRHKRYSALTTKAGDTLWAFSKKYGRSVAWLEKVNHISNPRRMPIGKKIRVR